MTCCDTSFLYSLYSSDAHTPQAVVFLRGVRMAVTISELTRFELHNALRLAFFRKLLDAGQLKVFLGQFDGDLGRGLLSLEQINLAEILAEAGRISESNTPSGGHRGFDILHVAAAKHMGASTFLTFDQNQQKLAKSVGLKTPL